MCNLALAWALTLDRVRVDLSGSFVLPGMAYVALSEPTLLGCVCLYGDSCTWNCHTSPATSPPRKTVCISFFSGRL